MVSDGWKREASKTSLSESGAESSLTRAFRFSATPPSLMSNFGYGGHLPPYLPGPTPPGAYGFQAQQGYPGGWDVS